MKHLKKFSKFFLVGCMALLLANCQKEDARNDAQILCAKTGIDQLKLKSANLPVDYLNNLIGEINSLVSEGVLNTGQGNSLIVKINNYLKNASKGGSNESLYQVSATATGGSASTSTNQLNALMNQLKSLVAIGVLTAEQAKPLIKLVENEILMVKGSFIDPRDGQEYSAVLIGEQWWMAENLRATKYRNGDPIPNITNANDWLGLSTGAYCEYIRNEISMANIYGKLYNYYTVADNRNLCPTGWHVPSDAEWTTLITYLGDESVAGGQLKETGIIHWDSPNEAATNSTGFTALPGGYRHPATYGSFSMIYVTGNWWSSTESSASSAWSRSLSYKHSEAFKIERDKKVGNSVRCLKD